MRDSCAGAAAVTAERRARADYHTAVRPQVRPASSGATAAIAGGGSSPAERRRVTRPKRPPVGANGPTGHQQAAAGPSGDTAPITNARPAAPARSRQVFGLAEACLLAMGVVHIGVLLWVMAATVLTSAAPPSAAAAPASQPITTTSGTPLFQPIGSAQVPVVPLAPQELWELREEARESFYHAYDNYMEHAYPWDELKPLSCEPRRWDRRERGTLDDNLGGFALTQVDALDMLAVVGDYKEFAAAVDRVIAHVTFDRNVTVSVFETTIRVIGSLLSAHLIAADPDLGIMPHYQGGLLSMALDLGHRIMPAFATGSGLPTHRVNLRHGVEPGEQRETCTAAAGTLVLELGLLSRLTGEPQFELAARRAVRALWKQRSKLNLVGASVDTQTGKWRGSHTGIGAGVDSFYEYLLKTHLLFGDEEWREMFQEARAAVHDHLKFGSLFVEVGLHQGRLSPRRPVVSSLQAFWPALDVIAGDVEAAIESYMPLWQLWTRFEALPEAFDIVADRPIHFAKDAPLRPELIESAFYLFRATQDHTFLHHAKRILRALNQNSKVECGYASIADVTTKRLDDRMDSYFLAETTKYLFLLFDHALVPSGHAQLHGNRTAWYRASSLGVDGDTGADGGEPSPDTGSCAAASASAGACDEACGDSCAANTTADGEAFQFPFPVLSERHRLALRVRQPRGGVAAMPMDPAVTVFTTEGHLLPLRSGAAGVCGAEGPFEAWKDEVCSLHARGSHSGPPHGHHPDTLTGKQRAQARRALNRRLALAGTPEVVSGAAPDDGAAVSTRAIRALAHVDHLRVTASEVAAARHPASAKKTPAHTSKGKSNKRKSPPAPRRGAAAPSTPASRPPPPSPPPSIAVGYSRRAGSTKASDQRVALVSCDNTGCTIRGGPARVKLVATHPCGAVGVPTACDVPESSAPTCAPAASWGGDDASLYASSVELSGAPAQFGAPLGAASHTPSKPLVVAQPPSGCSRLSNRAAVSGSVVLMTRGTCSFVQKVRNAEQAGAVGAVVVDAAPAAPGGASGKLTSVMQDDGTGSDVHIPSVLLQPPEAQAFLTALGLARSCLSASASPSSHCGLLRRGRLVCPHNVTLSVPPLPPSLSFPPDLATLFPSASGESVTAVADIDANGAEAAAEQYALIQALTALFAAGAQKASGAAVP